MSESVAESAPIAISARAAAKIRELIDEEGNPALKLRVQISGGGCSGFQYGFAFEEQVEEDDVVIEAGPVTVIVDPISLQYLEGAAVDYQESLAGAHFVVTGNPHAKTTCGCGASFSV